MKLTRKKPPLGELLRSGFGSQDRFASSCYLLLFAQGGELFDDLFESEECAMQDRAASVERLEASPETAASDVHPRQEKVKARKR